MLRSLRIANCITMVTMAIMRMDGTEEAGYTQSKRIARLPTRLGGLGLGSTEHTRPAAYWASWANMLEMIAARDPRIAERVLGCLQPGSA